MTWQWYARLNSHFDGLALTGSGVSSCPSVDGYARDLAEWSEDAELETGWPIPLEHLHQPARQFLASGGSCGPRCGSRHAARWQPRWNDLGLLTPDDPQRHADRVADVLRVADLAPDHRAAILGALLETWSDGVDAARVRRRCLGEG